MNEVTFAFDCKIHGWQKSFKHCKFCDEDRLLKEVTIVDISENIVEDLVKEKEDLELKISKLELVILGYKENLLLQLGFRDREIETLSADVDDLHTTLNEIRAHREDLVFQLDLRDTEIETLESKVLELQTESEPSKEELWEMVCCATDLIANLGILFEGEDYEFVDYLIRSIEAIIDPEDLDGK
jgi:hypothetical protein